MVPHFFFCFLYTSADFGKAFTFRPRTRQKDFVWGKTEFWTDDRHSTQGKTFGPLFCKEPRTCWLFTCCNAATSDDWWSGWWGAACRDNSGLHIRLWGLGWALLKWSKMVFAQMCGSKVYPSAGLLKGILLVLNRQSHGGRHNSVKGMRSNICPLRGGFGPLQTFDWESKQLCVGISPPPIKMTYYDIFKSAVLIPKQSHRIFNQNVIL